MLTKTKYLSLPLLATFSVLALSACNSTSNPTHLPPGEYSRTEESTNSAGTAVKETTNTDVYYDQDGNKRATQETETSRDPEGLFNKSKSTSTKTYN